MAFLLRAGKLGAFDFNSRFYADDDLMVGAADPFQLFRIMHEVVPRRTRLDAEPGVAFMLDQCHNIEPKIPGQIRSVMNVQEATAKALLVDHDALAAAQRAGDVLGANAVLMDAYNTDVRPLLRRAARGAGPRPRPDAPPTRASGYAEQIVRRAGRRRPGRLGRVSRDAPCHRVDRGRDSRALIARSNRLGADPRNTNYAGGNTSAKGTATDPVTGEPVELLWVKGSGGDLGTLTEAGLAVLRLDRLRALVDVYPASTARTRWSPRSTTACTAGAAPRRRSTPPCTASSTRAHVDHLHPDSGIALATAADGEALTEGVLRRPGGVGALAPPGLPARPRHRRGPAGEPAGDRRASSAATASPPGATTSEECEAQLAGDHPHRRGVHRRAAVGRARSGRSRPGTGRCPRPSAARGPPRWRR